MKTFLVIAVLFLLALILSRPVIAQSPSFPVGQGFYPAGGYYVPIQVDANGVVQTD